MTKTERALVARNEIENLINDVSRDLGLSEDDMVLIIDAVSNTVRHKALTRNAYMEFQKEREAQKSKEENGREKEENG